MNDKTRVMKVSGSQVNLGNHRVSSSLNNKKRQVHLCTNTRSKCKNITDLLIPKQTDVYSGMFM